VKLAGSVAIVTGAARGTGRAIALRLAEAGAPVVVADVDEAHGQETAALIERAGGTAAHVQTDVTDPGDLASMVAVAKRQFGDVRILVNNAGGTAPPHFPVAPVERWITEINLNLIACMHAIQAVLDTMQRAGGGSILNVASVAGVGTAPHSSPEYAAAKAGLIRLTATLESLRTTHNVRVNCLVPSWIGTEAVLAEVAAMQPEQRPRSVTSPDQIAAAIVDMVGDDELSGRIAVWWSGDARPTLLPISDRTAG
jgi:NAD(P)-dependent dehydrogenase (short-subunit alcohol dehydrogenase family)